MKNKLIVLLLAALLMGSSVSAEEKIPAFPDAEGGGMWTTGARGGENMEVYHVTNLNDSGEGSFRDAVSQSNRFIVFDVGGNINIESLLEIRADNLTILGQTAPGDGISIDGDGVYLRGSNIIMRYLRIRCGEGSTNDALWATKCENIIVDHCSVSWGMDECASFTNLSNATLQWSIVSEALNKSNHPGGQHGYGGIWGGMNFTGHHNLLASNNCRNPRIGTGATVRFDNPDTDGVVNVRNNVMYNWIYNVAYGGENGIRVNFVGNYYKPGPATSDKNTIYMLSPTSETSTSLPSNGGTTGAGAGKVGWSTTLHVDGNYMEGNEAVNNDNWLGVKQGPGVTLWTKCEEVSDGIEVDGVFKPNNQYLDTHPVITQDAKSAYDEVLKYAGASLKRDPIDTRVVNDVINKTAPTGTNSGYGMVDFIADVGGFAVLDGGVKEADSDNDGIADSWEIANGLDAMVHDSLTIAEDGYTMLEKYAEELAVHEGEEYVDKSELRKLIYHASNLDKGEYKDVAWNNLQSVLEEAMETVSVVYAPQSDIDNACAKLNEALALLDVDEKADLRAAIDNAMLIDATLYTADSYAVLDAAIKMAETVYADAEFVQADVDNAMGQLQAAIDGLEESYAYKLKNFISEIYKLNQADYTYDSMNALVMKLREVESLLGNADESAFKAKYEELHLAYEALVVETDTESRFKGDFEDFVRFGVHSGNYGRFRVNLETSSGEVAENIGGNSTKAFVLRDTASTRASLTYTFPKKLSGVFRFEGEFYFDEAIDSNNILLRLVDSKQSTPNYFTLMTRKGSANTYLRMQYFNEVIDFADAVIEPQKWHRIQVIFDTESKEYKIWIDGEKKVAAVFSNTAANVGIENYNLATPGSASQTMAVDNLKAEIIDGPMIINHEFIGNSLTCDIVNYEQEKLKLILASYEGDRLIDVNVQDIPVQMYAEDVTASVSSGDEIKVFLWKDEMVPVAMAIVK